MVNRTVHRFTLGRLGVAVWLAGAALAVGVSSCGDGVAGGDKRAAPDVRIARVAPVAVGNQVTAADYDHSLFDATSATITNRWLGFAVGKRFVWRGRSIEADELRSHRVVFTVTDMTKVIDGVRARVGWDRDYSGGELVESELVFLAQDKVGNVWHLGEYTEAWAGKEFDGASAWVVGSPRGARAGLQMRADDDPGSRPYSQGFAPAPYYWNDWSRVDRADGRTCVPAACYRDVLGVAEYDPRQPGQQLKYYAPGVGNVRVGWRGNDRDKESLVLDRIVQLGPQGIARARRAVRAHEARAYAYAATAPAERQVQ